MPFPHPLCPAGQAIYTDHDHADVPRHVDDRSFCNHTSRPEGLPAEVLVGLDYHGSDVPYTFFHVDMDADVRDVRDADVWVSTSGGERRLFRATLTYHSELTLIPPVPASTEERPVSWS